MVGEDGWRRMRVVWCGGAGGWANARRWAAVANARRRLGDKKTKPFSFTQTPDAFCVKADLPGMPKDAIKVDVDGDVLSIEAAREEEKTEAGGGDTVHRRERVATWAKRSLRLPTSADTGSVDAKYEDGVLQLTIPKKKEEKERKRKVEVK